ncbi:hypothetical protein [Actinomadura rupiterrae]|uniref:hypothetical protein n=1 Tax=Actinomadura rupiterrae TaxID=559627 RepID=UPI0020A2B622|nr:hypothetical protein [Actinomadura rupiterrae]MCP2342960.1 hypothetical protein [Actinomadura rupiterrae]
MKPRGDDDPIVLSFYCGPESETVDTCPAVHRTNRATWLWQGELRNDAQVRNQLRKPSPTEVGVEVGDDLVDMFVRAYAKEKYGVDLG